MLAFLAGEDIPDVRLVDLVAPAQCGAEDVHPSLDRLGLGSGQGVGDGLQLVVRQVAAVWTHTHTYTHRHRYGFID